MQEISHLRCALLLIYLLGRERELESTAPLPFSTSGNMFKFLSFHSAHRPFRDIALAGQKPGKPVAGRIFVLIDYQSTLRTRIRPLPHRHVLMIATLRATLGRISLAEVVHPVAVALCLALDHLHELVQASFIFTLRCNPWIRMLDFRDFCTIGGCDRAPRTTEFSSGRVIKAEALGKKSRCFRRFCSDTRRTTWMRYRYLREPFWR